jgi:hypothetical protein
MLRTLWLAAALLLQQGVSVSGRVTADEATRTRVIRVALTPPGGAEAVTTIIDSDGSFEFSNVKPGSYTAIAYAATSVSAPTPITVGAGDVTNLAIRLPDPKPIKGRITVQGDPANTPLPRVAFFLPPLPGIGNSGATIAANAQPDGSFTAALPIGERQISLANGSIPSGYKLTAFTYGSADLTKNMLRIAPTDTSELRVTFDASGVTLVNVRGQVTNLITTKGVRVVLMNPNLGVGFESSVSADGSFAFSKVRPGNYVVRLSLSGLAAGTQISVADRDLNDVVMAYPRQFIVPAHILVEGGADADASVVLEAKEVKNGTARTTTSINNLAMLNINDGEYNVSVKNIPAGYQLKSITYGTTDLQKAPLKIDGPVTWEIIVRLVASR